jgi:Tfp pilus assembly protein PilF
LSGRHESGVGRNDPCPCGSGERYKRCHGKLPADPVASAATLAERGLSAHRRGDVDAAERSYRCALALDAKHPLARHYLGVLLYQRKDYVDALPLIEESTAQVPQEPEFHNNLGLLLAALDRNDAAIEAYRRTLNLQPQHATAWNNLGLAAQAQNRLPEAIAAFRRSIALLPDFAHAHWNLSLALLAHGDYDEGFREYEWRLQLPELGGRLPSLAVPRWQGQDIRGRTLLVSAEQGLGDALQFIRFADRLAERGARVVVQAPADLCGLLATAAGVAATVATDEAAPAADAEIPLLSLPHRLGVVDVAPRVRYLRSDPELTTGIAARLAREGIEKYRIGIAWAGSSDHGNDRRRSMPLARLAPLFSIPGIRWYSLQKGARAAELEEDRQRDVVPLAPDSDFARTAALVDALDAVVTVDTSIAHLAGALGKDVLVMLPFAPDWRWGVSGRRTPWYPTASLFRQPAIGDWASVVADVRETLAVRVASGSRA